MPSFADYRREFSNKKSQEHQSAAESLLEINTNLNKETHFTSSQNRSTIDILKGTVDQNLAPSQNGGLHITPNLLHYDSAVPSPFLDKKMAPNTPQIKPRALSPTNNLEEHQYDIPFSHLKRSCGQDEIDTRHQIHQRKSRTSNRTSSGTSHGK